MGVWVLIAVIVAFDWYVVWKQQCDCSRSRRWYYDSQHERAWIMLARAIWSAACTIFLIFTVAWFWGPVSGVITVWCTRRWWFHERDKLKKKAAKLAGKVSFNSHGRLVVTSK